MKEKVKLKLDGRPDVREVDHKMPRGSAVDDDALMEAMAAAGWTDSPTDGKAVLLPDGSEFPSARQVSPPVGYKPEPDFFEMMRRQVQVALAEQAGDTEIDSIEDANDFGEDDEYHPSSFYELMADEAPALPEEPGEKDVGKPGVAPQAEAGKEEGAGGDGST